MPPTMPNSAMMAAISMAVFTQLNIVKPPRGSLPYR
jgi:hypothetical protein